MGAIVDGRGQGSVAARIASHHNGIRCPRGVARYARAGHGRPGAGQGPVVGESAVQPGYFADHQPPALLMLHPPSETMPSLPECNGAASGCVLLPGLPYLGLEHRAAWVEAEADGTITSMVSRVGGPDQPPRHSNPGNAARRLGIPASAAAQHLPLPVSWRIAHLERSFGAAVRHAPNSRSVIDG